MVVTIITVSRVATRSISAKAHLQKKNLRQQKTKTPKNTKQLTLHRKTPVWQHCFFLRAFFIIILSATLISVKLVVKMIFKKVILITITCQYLEILIVNCTYTQYIIFKTQWQF